MPELTRPTQITTVPAEDWMTPVIRVPKMTALNGGKAVALHFAAGQFFQTCAHNGHAVQKQRNATQQRGNVCDIHNDTPRL